VTTVSLAAGWQSAQGRRGANQDAALAERLPDGRELIAVADGMGGHRGGEEASRRALATLSASVRGGLPFTEAVVAANAGVYAAAQQHAEWAGMGTTLVALLRSGDSYHIANVGDSRAYRVTSGELRQLTRDHSYAAAALRDGVSPEQLRRSPWRNALTRSIGQEPTVDVDVFGPFDAVEPHVIVLCSDGLHGSLGEGGFRACLREAADPQEAARLLAEAAHGNGSSDNITAAVVVFGGRPLAELLGGGRPRLHVSPPEPQSDDEGAAAAPPTPERSPVPAGSAPATAAYRRPAVLLPPPRARPRRFWQQPAVIALLIAGLLLAALLLTRL
jgi:PPM family protein phosphatase